MLANQLLDIEFHKGLPNVWSFFLMCRNLQFCAFCKGHNYYVLMRNGLKWTDLLTNQHLQRPLISFIDRCQITDSQTDRNWIAKKLQRQSTKKQEHFCQLWGRHCTKKSEPFLKHVWNSPGKILCNTLWYGRSHFRALYIVVSWPGTLKFYFNNTANNMDVLHRILSGTKIVWTPNYCPQSGGYNWLRPPVRPSVRPSVCLSFDKCSKEHYQSKVFVCVSIISGRMQIIAQMRTTGF